MKRAILIILSICKIHLANCQLNYWQQEVNFTINVSLDDTAKTLNGFEKIEYINHSPDTLKFIWFHLWPNAYKNDKTAFSDQLLVNDNTKFYFSDKDQKGYINRLDFRVNGTTALVEDHPQHIDIVKVNLPAPLPPGQKILITTPFHEKLPYNFSRGGYDQQSFQVTQWYPKPAVYDKNGWHPMPYLDQGEFYSEFGSFDVTITVPKNYVVAATGELQNEEEKAWLQAKIDSTKKNLIHPKPGKDAKGKIIVSPFPPTEYETKTLKFRQNNVHDFAWFADKRFIVNSDTVILSSGRVVQVYSYYIRPDYVSWQKSVEAGKSAIRHYSELVGEYPYNLVSIVEGPESFGGGMEYPTITVISPTANVKELESTIVHEIGHNWFYGILATNERDHPWMDEGVNTYYDEKYRRKYVPYPQWEKIGFETKAVTITDQPINLPSEEYSKLNYDLVVYYKTGAWLRWMESKLGTEVFNKSMQQYFRDWKFKHPQPEDFKKEFETVSGKNLDEEFHYLEKTGLLPNQHGTGVKKALIFDFKDLNNYLVEPSKQLITYGPALGVNSYDKIMVGAFVTNIKLPPSRLLFLMAPMYATGSKSFTGLGMANYSFYPASNILHNIDLMISAAHFTQRKFVDDKGRRKYLAYTKIEPGLTFRLKQKDERSSVTRLIQFKAFSISEEGLSFSHDTISAGPPPVVVDNYKVISKERDIQQMILLIENNRVLYPYSGELKAELGKYFLRLGFTGKYFFNYPKHGGLNVRLYAGKFIYTATRTPARQFATDRYHLNLSGPNGYEDYTYSDYFAGRNHFTGWQSQQLMIRDGAFKVRTDLLAQQVGKTDDWLAAANFISDIPPQVNPFMLLPVKLPVRVFFDIGTYAEAWKQNAQTDRFLYDAGLYLPLLKGLVNIYVPLIYSNVYGDYYKSTIAKKERFWKKIGFSIGFSDFNLRKLQRTFSY